ncbi:MAG TPA: hypothetical protein VLC08_16155 [Chitinolyticbacter sp.]|nr:hypothetical protein [Chitinolyticbacter sp.]
MNELILRGLCATLLCLLAACGGGGDASPSAASPTPPTAPLPAEAQVDCSGSACGALPGGVYAGHGVASWRYDNADMAPRTINVQLSNVAGRTATLALSNPGAAPMALTAQVIAASRLPDTNADSGHIARFNHNGFLPYMNAVALRASRTAQAVPAQLGSSRSWIHEDESERVATLVRQIAAQDGRTVNLWLENAETGPAQVNPALLDRLAMRVAGQADSAYELVTGLAGPIWGAHAVSGLILANQPLDVVLLNFDHNARPWGLLGYFWSRNNLTRSAHARSNEALAVFLDTETLYLGGTGALDTLLSTLAHELSHAANFYRRGVQRYQAGGTASATFETWLEEMSAMMAEDLLAARLTPGFNAVRDIRVRDWLTTGAFNCNFTRYDATAGSGCNSYSVGGSLGAYLLRHYGVAFYRDLLASAHVGDDVALLDAQLQAHGGSLDTALRQSPLSVADLPADSPAGMGLPARDDAGYALPAITVSQLGAARLATTPPAALAPYGALLWQRRMASATHNEVVLLPPGARLTVVVR